MRVTVIGDGGWGTALALVLNRNGHAVSVWGPFPGYVAEIACRRENPKFLPGVALPPAIAWEPDPAAAVAGAELCVLASPSKYFPAVVERFAPLVPRDCRVVSVTKGLSRDGHQRMTQVAETLLGRGPVAALSGPSHAEEVARGVPTAVVVACSDPGVARQLQAVFTGPLFRVYWSDDAVGVELGGALKNVIAIAAGVSDGIGFGDNTKAALITRGLAEMARLGAVLGARPETFAGLSGMGDLVVTCTSRLSRNRGVGERLGRGETLADIMEHMEQAAEGVWTCAAARQLAADMHIELPITQEVYAVAHEGKDPRQAVTDLLSRDPKPETGT